MPNLINGKFINGYSSFKCICGSTIQSRNISNHFLTNKHQNFLLDCKNLMEDYEEITADKIAFKLQSYRTNVNKTKKYNLPITLTFD